MLSRVRPLVDTARQRVRSRHAGCGPARRRLAVPMLLALVAGCAPVSSPVPTGPPATPEPASSAEITPVPAAWSLAGACPSLERARAAVPDLVAGPEVNTEPFKTMVLQCNYTLHELDASGRQAGIGILVFDASAEGALLWDSVRTDPTFPDPTEIPDLAEVAFATGTPGHQDVWVVQGRYGFHMSHLRPSGIPLDQMVALARAMVEGLGG